METNKQRKYANISSAVQKVLIYDKIKTQWDQWASLQASGKRTAFLHWLLNLLCCRPFLRLQDYYCSSVVINNDLGVYIACLQLNAPLILVLPFEQAWTTHPTSLLLSLGRQETPATDLCEKTKTSKMLNCQRTIIQIETIQHISFMTATRKTIVFVLCVLWWMQTLS